VSEIVVRGIDIRNQQWDVALDAILASQGLGWHMQAEGILIVDKLEGLLARDTLQTETRVFRINYASADSVATTLMGLATPNRGQVVAYQGANSVIVTDAPSVVARMDTLIRALDRKTPQVSIEAKIIFVDRTDVNSLGIVWDLKDRTGNSINDVIGVEDPLAPGTLTNATLVDLTGESIAALANANDRVLAPSLQILASTAFGDFTLTAFLDALEQHQLSDVQAAPSIQVVDNHNARILVGERTPIRILEQGAQVADARVNVQFEETGIILDVTPHITNNGQILLDVSAERSGLQTDLPDVGFNFTQQQGKTRLLLDDGETMVIGGLTLSEVDRNESGIPLLMNLPLIGGLFRTTKNTETKKDLIILVTPHIVP
jgi:type IV pilus assembly protein PilQ